MKNTIIDETDLGDTPTKIKNIGMGSHLLYWSYLLYLYLLNMIM